MPTWSNDKFSDPDVVHEGDNPERFAEKPLDRVARQNCEINLINAAADLCASQAKFDALSDAIYHINHVTDAFTKTLGRDRDAFVYQLKQEREAAGRAVDAIKMTIRVLEAERGNIASGDTPDQAPSGVTPLNQGILQQMYGGRR